jgi:pyruvate dehydrogenase E2 component (dihydrolipoamide acetyltransferase)
MPSLGADMDAGTIVEWLVHPGDAVRRGDIVAVVATDKADIEVEVFETGVVEELLVPPGETVPVGAPLARIRAEGAPAPEPAAPEPAAPPPAAPAPTPEPEATGEAAAPPTVGATLSPVLRRLAKHLGVDLAAVTGTGPGGTLTRADIEAAADRGAPTAPLAPAPPPAPARDRAGAMRDALAALMARSKREIPHYYLSTDVDFSRARDWLDATNATKPVTERILPAVLAVKAVALAAREHPEVNGTWVDGGFVPASEVNVGVAISLRDGGLIAPALAIVDAKPLAQVAAELRDLVHRTRNGRLRAAEMSGPTITVTNLGDQGVDRVFGVIYPPQVALVGVGRITERPWARDGMVGAHPVVTLSLSGDHRVSDGHRGGLFLARVDRLLQTPEEL